MPRFIHTILCLLVGWMAYATTPFRVAQLTDIHLSRSNPKPLEDLRRSIDDINYQLSIVNSDMPPIAFVLVTGDITEAGDRESMETAKREFDRLQVPCYCTSGNHETTWSESGCTDFPRVFGSDHFSFVHNDICFIGFNSGPRLKMSDGHVVPQDLTWAKHILDSLPQGHKVIGVTHYPLQEGDVDNWYEVTSLFRHYNTQCFIGGHYHRNLLFNADGMPNVLCRSNLRGKADINGYTIITFDEDEIVFAEKVIGEQASEWLTIPSGDASLTRGDSLPRPSFAVNKQYKRVKEVWNRSLGVGIYCAPAYEPYVANKGYRKMADKSGRVFVGDDLGKMYCLDYETGNTLWCYQTGSRINSTPAVFAPQPPAIKGIKAKMPENRIVFGSTDGCIYCLSSFSGELLWKYDTGLPVMGCPVIAEGTVFVESGSEVRTVPMVLIGGQKAFYALDVVNGDLLWETPIDGYCVSRPCVYNDKVYFGAWGCYFYALDIRTGKLVWRWSNGSTNDKYSPAAVWPVASNNKVFIVAPDRYMTCLNAQTGEQIWRTNHHMVRENMGISSDGNIVYVRCMQDSVVAIDATTDTLRTIWKESAEYGYDHNPSMMIELGNQIVFGTKNGLMHGVDAATGKVLWRHKIGNCLVNTICPINQSECIITSSDGQVIRLKVPAPNPSLPNR